jgi:hypothetical protein
MFRGTDGGSGGGNYQMGYVGYQWNNPNYLELWSQNNGIKLKVGTASGEGIWIDTNNRLGIGNSTPHGKLTVGDNPNGYAGGYVFAHNPNGADSTNRAELSDNAVLLLQPHATNSTHMAFGQVNGGNGMGIQVTNFSKNADWDIALNPFGGNVGVGRVNPQSRLDVMDSARITSSANNSHGLKLEARTDFANDVDSSLIWISSGGTSTNPLFTSQGAHLVIEGRKSAARHIYFKVGDTTSAQHIMAADGNVGIGSLSPGFKLDVAGSVRFGGTEAQNRLIKMGTGENAIYMGGVNTNTLNVAYDYDGSYNLHINYNGYQGSTSQFRSLEIDNGKRQAIAYFNGSNKQTTFYGNVVPNGNGTLDLGTNTSRWNNIYTSDLHLSNEAKGPNEFDGTTGDWTIQEGEEELYIKNNKTGKKYAFVLREIE